MEPEDFLPFIKQNSVPTELESIVNTVSCVLLENLLKQIEESNRTETLESLFYSQFLFKPNTDTGVSTLTDFYSSELTTNDQYTEKVKEFSSLVLNSGINTKNVKKIKIKIKFDAF